MIEKTDVIEFFDSLAEGWDEDNTADPRIAGKILDSAGVEKGSRLLDVACGTGVMLPCYLERGASVTGIDISPAMVRLAREKFPGENVICADIEETAFREKFDCIIVYNAFPHFPDPERLIAHLSGLLKEGGRLTVAHGASREEIDSHHKGAAAKVSKGLMPAEDLAGIFAKHLTVKETVSDSSMYMVTGVLQ